MAVNERTCGILGETHVIVVDITRKVGLIGGPDVGALDRRSGSRIARDRLNALPFCARVQLDSPGVCESLSGLSARRHRGSSRSTYTPLMRSSILRRRYAQLELHLLHLHAVRDLFLDWAEGRLRWTAGRHNLMSGTLPSNIGNRGQDSPAPVFVDHQ